MDQNQNNGQQTKKYTVYIYERVIYSVEVEATSEKNAENKALDIFNGNPIPYTISSDITEIEVEE